MANYGKAKPAPRANAVKQAAQTAKATAPASAPKPVVPMAMPATDNAPVPAKPVTKPAAPAQPVAKPVAPAKPVAKMVEAEAKTAEAGAAKVRKASDEAKTVVAKTAAIAAKVAAPVKAAAETAAKSIQINANKDNPIMTTVQETMNKSQAMFGDAGQQAKAQMQKNSKIVEEMNAFAKGNVEALVESSKIAAKGFEAMGQESADFTRKSFEKATAAMKEMSSVKSPADFFKLQSDFVRETFDSMIAVTSKNTEAMMKLAGDAAQPMSSRYAVAVEKVKTAA